MKEETRGLFLAVILSVIAIFVTNYLFPTTPAAPQSETEPEIIAANESSAASQDENKIIIDEKPLTTAEVVTSEKRIKFSNDSVYGSIRLKGARFDELYLSKYKTGLEKNSPDIELLSPARTIEPYYAEFGWLSNDRNLKLPDNSTEWHAKTKELTPETPLVLEYNNGQGLRFIRKISLDKNYMFNIEQSVENNTGKEISLYPYGLISRTIDQNKNSQNAVVHEGMLGVIDSSLKEIKYSSLKKQGEREEFKTNGGWVGFGDRYWFSSLVLGNNQNAKVKFSKTAENTYQIDYLGAETNVAPGSIGTQNIRFYSGAKEIKLLDNYTKTYNIDKFDLAVDFGWYYFLTKPFFYILDFLYHIIGNMGWAILLFAALLRLAMYPIANKSYESMSKMKKVQPKMLEIQERYKDDKVKMQQEIMNLYRKEKINPAAGCLPVLIQIPVFFSLYKVLNISIEIRHAPFIGWIKDLSAPDPLTISVWSHLPIPGILDIGIWPILMGISMYIQQKLNPAPTNKDQARVFALLPLIFTFMLGHFASGLIIYWTLSNLLSIIQQKAIMRKIGV